MLDPLSAVVGALAGAFAAYAVPRVMGRPDHDAGETATRAASCAVCEEGFDSVDEARDHAIDTHAAISDLNWHDVVEVA